MNIVQGFYGNHFERQSPRTCRFYQRGICRFGVRCRNIHGEVEPPRLLEEKATIPDHSKDKTTISPKVENTPCAYGESSPSNTQQGPSTSTASDDAESLNKTCGICFDAIIEKKDKREQVYGILPNCSHCFCFTCIRKWRQSKEFDFDVSKACPECRTASSYVYPSKVWFEIKEEKDTFISKENSRMQNFDCRYFKKGSGTCPFGNTCLYRHALPNGKKMDVGPPRPRRHTGNIDHELVHQILYWLSDDDNLDIDEDDVDLNEFELDLNDPAIAMQYYDHDDIRRYIAIERLMNPSSDTESDDYDFPLFL